MTETLSLLDPRMMALIILGLFAALEFAIIVKITNIARAYAKMTVSKARILSDGKITLDEPDVLPFIEETFRFMAELESLVHYLTGYILNHPSTGWIKGYAPQLIAVEGAVFQELIKDEDLPKSDPIQTPPATIPEQPALPVSTVTGGSTS